MGYPQSDIAVNDVPVSLRQPQLTVAWRSDFGRRPARMWLPLSSDSTGTGRLPVVLTFLYLMPRVAIRVEAAQPEGSRPRYNPLLVQCQLCERTFRNRSGLTQHHNVAHAKRAPLSAASRLLSPAGRQPEDGKACCTRLS